MFEPLREEIQGMGQTIQVAVDSTLLEPKVSTGVDGERVFSLIYEGEEYRCLKKGWTSWAQKILVPNGETQSGKYDLVDESTGRKKRWSTATVQRFLEMTPVDMAQDVVTEWWNRHEPQQWNVVKYADGGSIRFIGTSRYRLYKHEDFLEDLAKTKFSGMLVQDATVNEDRMIIRVTDNDPLQDVGKNMFAGYHIMNSENGSSSISIVHMIYDLLCTNGLMEMFDQSKVMIQKHIGFDVDDFRDKVVDISETLDELHGKSVELVRKLVSHKLDEAQVDAIFKMYERRYDASQAFIGMAKEYKIKTLWDLVSAITEKCQKYGWDKRLSHESNAGRLLRAVLAEKHLKYME